MSDDLTNLLSGIANPPQPGDQAQPGPAQQGTAPAPAQAAPAPQAQQQPAPTPRQPQEADQQERQGFLAGVGNFFLGTGAGAVRAAPMALGGAADFADDIGRAVAAPAISYLTETNPEAGQAVANFYQRSGLGSFSSWYREAVDTDDDGRANFAGILSDEDGFGRVGNDMANNMTAQIGAVMLPYARLSSLSKAAAIRAPASVLGRYGAAIESSTLAVRLGAQNLGLASVAGIVLSPDEERASNFLQDLGVENPYIDWLAQDDEDGVLESRFKNAIEELTVGVIADGIFQSFRAMRAFSRGDTAVGEEAQALAQAATRDAPVPDGPAPSSRSPQPAPGSSRAAGTSGRAADGTQPRRSPGESATPDRPPLTREDLAGITEDIIARRAAGGSPDIRLGTATGKRVGQFSIGALGSADEVPYTLRSMLEALPTVDHKFVRSDEELMTYAKAAADEIGSDPTAMMEAGRIIAGRFGNADAGMATLQTVWARASRSLDDIVGVDWKTAPDEAIDEALSRVHNMMSLSGFTTSVKSSLGRGLRVRRLPDADTYMANFVKNGDVPTPTSARNPSPLPRSRQELNDWLELWRVTRDDPSMRETMLEGLNSLPGGIKHLRQSFANLFTGSILSATRTLALNVSGPALVSGIRTIERTSGAFIAAVANPTLSMRRRGELLRTAAAAPQAYIQTMGDIGASLKFGMQALRENRQILGGGGYIDTLNSYSNISKAARDASARATGSRVANEWAFPLGNALNIFPRQVARINNGMDEFAKRLAYLGEVRAAAIVRGAREGVEPGQMQAYVRKSVSEATDATGAAADQSLLREAERTTFTSQPGEAGTFARRVAQTLITERNNVPEIRYIIPILNVPVNALGESLRRIPGINLLLKNNVDELMGNMGPIKQADAHGRMVLGALTFAGGTMMAANGIITGGGPKDPRAASLWRQTHQPYSIRVGNQWVDYSRYDIIGQLLGIPAILYDRSVHREPQEPHDRALGAVGAMAEYFRDRAALQGISDIMNFGGGTSEEADISYIERTLGGIAGRLATPNLVTTLLRNTTDPIQRTPVGMMERIVDLMPGASTQLDPLRNVLGEPIHRAQNTAIENLLPITFASVTNYETDDVMDELARVYETSGYAAGIPSTSAIGGRESREFKLDNGQSLYDAVVEARMDVTIDGRNLRQYLTEVINGQEYAEAVDGPANLQELTTGEISRSYLVSRVFSEFSAEARSYVARNNPEAARFIAAADIRRRSPIEFRDHSITDIARNPDLASALGIDMGEFEANARGD